MYIWPSFVYMWMYRNTVSEEPQRRFLVLRGWKHLTGDPHPTRHDLWWENIWQLNAEKKGSKRKSHVHFSQYRLLKPEVTHRK